MQLVSQKYIQNSRNAKLSYLMCRGGFSPDGNEKPGVPRSIFFLVEKITGGDRLEKEDLAVLIPKFFTG